MIISKKELQDIQNKTRNELEEKKKQEISSVVNIVNNLLKEQARLKPNAKIYEIEVEDLKLINLCSSDVVNLLKNNGYKCESVYKNRSYYGYGNYDINRKTHIILVYLDD